MRPFFAFLGLLLWLLPVQADEQAVIKDFEAITTRRQVRRGVRFSNLRHEQSVRDRLYQFRTRNTPTSHLPGSLQPIQELRLTRSQNYKGKTSASSARLNFIRGNRRLK